MRLCWFGNMGCRDFGDHPARNGLAAEGFLETILTIRPLNRSPTDTPDSTGCNGAFKPALYACGVESLPERGHRRRERCRGAPAAVC